MKKGIYWTLSLLMTFHMLACSKKGGSPAPAGDNPGGDGGVPPASDEQQSVDQSLARFELKGRQGVHYNAEFAFQNDGTYLVLTGLVGSNASSQLEDFTDSTRAFANVRTFEGLGIVAVVAGVDRRTEASLYIFARNTDDTYTLMTGAIGLERRAALDRLSHLVSRLVQRRSLSVSEAFALIIRTHRDHTDWTFEQIGQELRREGEVRPAPDRGDEDPRQEEDEDYGQYPAPHPDLGSGLNDDVIIMTSPTGVLPPGTLYQPTPADHTPPWRVDEYNPGAVPPSHVELDPRWSDQDRIFVRRIPQIPPTDRNGHHTWAQCFASNAWTAGGVREDNEGRSQLCSNARCTQRWHSCCSPREGGQWCRILEPGEDQVEYIEVREEQSRQREYRQGSVRVRCGHRSPHSNHFRSGSNLTYRGDSRSIREIDMCIADTYGSDRVMGSASLRHESWSGIGSSRYFGGVDVTVEVDFRYASFDNPDRMIRDVDLYGRIEILDERSLMSGSIGSGRAEFLKSFTVRGPRSDHRDYVNLACEVTYHANTRCR